MHRFNTPPGWPLPPDPDWEPPRGWLPDPDWPTPPKGWKFWVNERGGRSLGPAGTYGSASRGWIAGGAAAAGVALVSLLVVVAPDSSATAAASSQATVTATATTTATETLAPSTVTIKPTPMPRVTVTVTVTKRAAPFVGPGRTSAPARTAEPTRTTEPSTDAYYANCAAARAAGVAPLHPGEPGYRSGLDRDHDGIACE